MITSELIANLQAMMKTYGDLKVTIAVSNPVKEKEQSSEAVLSSEDLYVGYDRCSDREDEINIRNFPY